MFKQEIRQLYQQKRNQLTQQEVMRLNDLLLIRFQQWPVPGISTLLSYLPIPGKAEADMHLMERYLCFRIPGLRLAYPVISLQQHTITAMQVTTATSYRTNHYGIAEPVDGEATAPNDIDAVFVPLLAFDNRGYRVGYGKGYYDRFFSNCRVDVLKIGFSYFQPVAAIGGIHEFDVPLNVCITPLTIYEF